MDMLHYAAMVAVFIAVAFALQGLFELFANPQSEDDERLDKRLRQLRSAARSADGISLFRSKAARHDRAIDKMIAQMPSIGSFSEVLAQSGHAGSAAGFVGTATIYGAVAASAALLFQPSLVLVAAAALIAFALPFLLLMRTRRKRLLAFEKQLPEAVELIARALRAGHAFAPSLQMIADELPAPLAGEFRQVSEEIAFGIPLRDALLSLTRRVPIDDLRYFVIAVLLQRETGGNLAEILDTIGDLIRQRFKLLGQVRVLTAEGRLSAWVLSLLPFVTGLGLIAINPTFVSVLWTDETGRSMLMIAGAMMAAGVFWLTRIVKIRI